jgi:hypothetical protein
MTAEGWQLLPDFGDESSRRSRLRLPTRGGSAMLAARNRLNVLARHHPVDRGCSS